jgi:hypothetical protein
MATLLVMTTGRTDVQLVKDEQRCEFESQRVGALHDEFNERGYALVDTPCKKGARVEALESGSTLTLCTPKFDAVWDWINHTEAPCTRMLILETTRQSEDSDPRHAGAAIKKRACEKGLQEHHIERQAYLGPESERLEDRTRVEDAIVRRTVVARIESAISTAVRGMDRVVVAASGGMPEIKALVPVLVTLHAEPNAEVILVEVGDGSRDAAPDVVVSREPLDPVGIVRSKLHARSLVDMGNFLGAWGAVSHLENKPGQGWTQVIQWLANFASSLPLPTGCDIPVLNHPRMAVRAALRVELALRANDIPRAVHGTVSFLESAFWDWLRKRDFLKEDDAKGSLDDGFTFSDPKIVDRKLFNGGQKNNKWRINDFVQGVEAWLARLNKPKLMTLWNVVKDNDIRELRNDVAHNEPTPAIMEQAKQRMRASGLWSDTDTFLTQPVVQDVLKELGETHPQELLNNLLKEVRRRLTDTSWEAGATG